MRVYLVQHGESKSEEEDPQRRCGVHQSHIAAQHSFGRESARILEKQNLLQMSQVLSLCPRINHQVVLLFKDSKSVTAEHGGSKFSNHFYKHARLKKQTQYAHRARGTCPSTKIRSGH